MKKIIFIGNRPSVLKALSVNKNFTLVKSIVIEQQLIIDEESLNIIRFKSTGQKKELVKVLQNIDFDICISAGCSYVLPMQVLPKDRLYINCHPSVLPLGRGIHPLNECFISGNNVAGITIHLLADKLDTGDILNQIEFDLTDEVDLSVLYGFIFDMEAELLIETLDDLIQNNFSINSVPQKGRGTYYSRGDKIIQFIAKTTTIEEFVNHSRAFSSSNLGIKLITNQNEFIVYFSQIVKNDFILKRYRNIKPGNVIFGNTDIVLIKLLDGIIKINKFIKV